MNAAHTPPQEISAFRPQSAWRWIPTLYFCEGIPNVVVTSVAVVMFKNLKVSNTDIAFFTSLAYLPWVIKPLWSPLIDLLGTKRRWIVLLQFAVGFVLATTALAVPGPDFFRYTLAGLWLLAFSSATHDIAADGFYLLALPPHQQAAFVGVRNTCYRLAALAGKGGLVGLSGWLLGITGSVTQAWSVIFLLLAALFFLAGFYHLWALPVLTDDHRVRQAPSAVVDFLLVFKTFFARPKIGVILGFLLFYRLAEALALKLVEPFLLDARNAGGLGLTNGQLGLVNGTGVVALLAGGLLGGWLISRHGLRRMLWPMILVMHVPIAIFLLLAVTQPASLLAVGAALTFEQFGYGFGFTAYMVYMMLVAGSEHRTAHYAICTGFMALGLLLPGMAAGWLQEKLGYLHFFLWVCVATIPSFAATALLKIDPAFGRKN